MTWRLLGVLVLVAVLSGCGKHYWESPGRGVHEFSLDSTECINEATGKYGVASEGIYRACMKARGWVRVQSPDPSDRQFRGPEDEDEFASPPDPLSQRGVPVSASRDPSCSGPTATRRAGVVCR
jgi:hypothetical protein